MSDPDATPTEIGEFELIRAIRDRAGTHPKVQLGIGDDAAILSPPGPSGRFVVATDMLLDGRHFHLLECGAEAAGFKSLAVNLSDIAAMAARPVAAFVAVGLPRGAAPRVARGLIDGMAPLLERFGCALAGGDTNAWDGPLVVCVTVVGEGRAPGPVTRGGAKAGDAILVTGPLGGSLLGRHLRPDPRIEEALALLGAASIHALIDLSDGLGSDLGHILAESGGLGATLVADAIPIHPDARTLAERDGRSPLDHALGDGEDFELCLAVTDNDAERLLADPPPGVALRRIGRIEAAPGLRIEHPDGTVATVEGLGFDHFKRTEGGGDAG